MSKVDVAIIGAGPNGLSIAAHLAARGVSFRIFGKLMDSWQQMPKGMHLKSEGNASNLYDPQSDLTLAKYSAAAGWEYADLGVPVPLANFIEYGEVFQRKFVRFASPFWRYPRLSARRQHAGYQAKRTRMPSNATPVSLVVHVSPAETGSARVSVPVVMISPAASGGLT